MEPYLPEPIDAKPKRSGLQTFVRAALGITAALLLTCGVGGYLFFRSERGQQFLEGMERMAEVAQEGSRAPGTANLRELGCEQAVAWLMHDELEAFELFLSKEQAEQFFGAIPPDTTLVGCILPKGGAALTCADVARTYGAVVTPPANLMVFVGSQGFGQSLACSGIYSPTGELIEALDQDR